MNEKLEQLYEHVFKASSLDQARRLVMNALIEELSDFEGQVYHTVRNDYPGEGVTARDISSLYHVSIQRASTVLGKLHRMWLLKRQVQYGPLGMFYRYEICPPANANDWAWAQQTMPTPEELLQRATNDALSQLANRD